MSNNSSSTTEKPNISLDSINDHESTVHELHELQEDDANTTSDSTGASTSDSGISKIEAWISTEMLKTVHVALSFCLQFAAYTPTEVWLSYN